MLANCQDIGGFAKKRVKLLFYKVVRHQKKISWQDMQNDGQYWAIKKPHFCGCAIR